MKKIFKKLKFGAATLSITSIIFGIFLIIFPQQSLQLLCFVLGGVSLFLGVVNIISYLSKYDFEKFYHMGFATGIIFALIGAFLLFRSNLATNILVIVIGLLVFINSIIKLPGAFDLKRAGVRYWWIAAALSTITAIIGGVMFCTPYSFKEFIVILVGLSFVVEGISNIFWSLYISTKLKMVEEEKSLKDKVIDVEYEEKK